MAIFSGNFSILWLMLRVYDWGVTETFFSPDFLGGVPSFFAQTEATYGGFCSWPHNFSCFHNHKLAKYIITNIFQTCNNRIYITWQSCTTITLWLKLYTSTWMILSFIIIFYSFWRYWEVLCRSLQTVHVEATSKKPYTFSYGEFLKMFCFLSSSLRTSRFTVIEEIYFIRSYITKKRVHIELTYRHFIPPWGYCYHQLGAEKTYTKPGAGLQVPNWFGTDTIQK